MQIILLRHNESPTVYSVTVNGVKSGYIKYNNQLKRKELIDQSDEVVSFSRNTVDYEKQLKNEICTIVSLREKWTRQLFLSSWFWQTYTMNIEVDKQVNVLSHRGTKFSFFIDNKQVGSYSTHDEILFSKKLVIDLKNELDPVPFLHVCLELYSDFSNEGKITKSPYNLWFEKAKFNKDWEP